MEDNLNVNAGLPVAFVQLWWLLHTRLLLLILVVAHVCVLILLYGIRGVCARRLTLWRRGRGRVWGCANGG